METKENNSLITKIQDGIKRSVTVKIIVITIIILLLLIPTSMIESLIHEREMYKESAIVEVSEKWGSDQVLSGPFISIPYKKLHKTKDDLVTYSIHYAHFLPEKLHVDSNVKPSIRKRGIYEIALYNGQLNVTGHFQKPDFSTWNIDPQLILWKDAHLSIGLTDLTGIKERIVLQWNDSAINISPGLGNHEVVASGVNARVPINANEKYNFSFTINANGSKSLGITPVGKHTAVNMTSSWPDPSFGGKFLPDAHTISEDGFKATWTILDLNRNYPQQWLGNEQHIAQSNLGVEFLLPVDEYQKNIRSIKYAILIIALTFLLFFLVEVLNGKRFHPIQYTLVGLAITLFYILLISITEHLGFNVAYLCASALTVGLISFYISSIFHSTKLTAIASVALVVIYFFIYIVLQLQDYSLLVGSMGLFIALSILMILSRKINWYQLGAKPQLEG